ncbi:MAG: metalloregulator ArsR/SmtB family transcription factor [Pseudomonadota bacterium]
MTALLQDAVSTLRAAGEDTRLRILALVRSVELTVSDLTAILGQSQPRVSRHLRILTDAGLLERYREGAWVFYRPPSRSASGAVAAVEAMVEALRRASDSDLTRDLERLEHIRAERAAVAAAYFERNAADWDALRRMHLPERDIEATMREMIGAEPVETFVDLGAGTGRMMELFGDLYREGVGYDLSRDMLRLARSKLETAGVAHAQVRQADILAAPYPSGRADIVCIHQVLHFLDDPGAAIVEAARLASEEGRVLIVDFAPHDHEFLREEHAHRRLGFSDADMRRLCARAGLSIVRIETLAPADDAAAALAVKIWLAERARPGAGEPQDRAEPALGDLQ